MMRMCDFSCLACGAKFERLVRNSEPVSCQCGSTDLERVSRLAATVRPDDIPGGLLIEHGLCNEDGSPRRYYSHSEITRECQKRGLIRWTDLHTEDKTKDARVRADWYQSSEAKRAKQLRDEARRERRR